MKANEALWEQGDFTRIAETMRERGEALVERIGVIQGQIVLDVGCGDRTTALPAAKRGTDVGGVDIADNLGAAGKRVSAIEPAANSAMYRDDRGALQLSPDGKSLVAIGGREVKVWKRD